MIALLCHDIGYVKGICADDNGYKLATGIGKKTITLPEGSTDAQLAPYHIDRSKRFVLERFGKKMLRESGGLVDAKLIASYIEMTRFPVPDDDRHKDTSGFPGLVRAADFIGQLADPNRLQKCTALFYEFEELGLNEKLGYKTPGDLRDCNAKFYWDIVSPYVQEALGYLKVTHEGKQWIANLQSNVFGNYLFADGHRRCEMPRRIRKTKFIRPYIYKNRSTSAHEGKCDGNPMKLPRMPKYLKGVAAVTLLSVALTIFLFRIDVPILHLFELKLYDLRFLQRGNRQPSPVIALAMIDEKSLDQEGRWPWPRSTIAPLVDRLSEDGAKVIGLDIGFLEPEENADPMVPQGFEEALTRLDASRGSARTVAHPGVSERISTTGFWPIQSARPGRPRCWVISFT